MRHGLWVVAALLVAANAPAQQAPPQPAFTFQEVMIPVRDGVHLQTAILTPTDKTGPLPILFRRTPYGVPDGPLPTVPDRKSTRLNSSHTVISYAVFCLKKKKARRWSRATST